MGAEGSGERAVESWELFHEDEGPAARRATSTGTWVTGVSLLGLLAIFVAYLKLSDAPAFADGIPGYAVYLAAAFTATLVGTIFIGYVLRQPNWCGIAALPLIVFGLFLGGMERDPQGRRLAPEKRPRMSATKAAGIMAVFPAGGLVLGFVLSGVEQKLLWRRGDGRVFWTMNWGLGTVRKDWRHEELRAFRFEDHLVEYRTKNGKQTMEFAKAFLVEQNGHETELVSSGPLVETRRAVEALAEHFELGWVNRVIRDGKVVRSIEGGREETLG